MDNPFGQNAGGESSGLEFLDNRNTSHVELKPNSLKECCFIIKQLFRKTDYYATEFHVTELQRRKLEKALDTSNNENKRICTDYSSTLKTLGETETALELCREQCKELKKKVSVAEINNEAFLSHLNQLQSLVKIQERTIEENKVKLKNYELEVLDMRKDIYYLVHKWQPKSKTQKRFKGIQKKYPNVKKNKGHEKFEETSDIDDEDFDAIDIPLVVSKEKSTNDDNEDHIMELDFENGRLSSEDTGRGSSLSDVFSSYEVSPKSMADMQFVDQATSPTRELLVDIGTNTTDDMTYFNITNDNKRSLIDRSTSPICNLSDNQVSPLNTCNEQTKKLKDQETNTFNITVDRATSPLYTINEIFSCEKERQPLLDVGTNTTDGLSDFSVKNKTSTYHVNRSTSPISFSICSETNDLTVVDNSDPIDDIFKSPLPVPNEAKTSLVDRCTSPVKNTSECVFNLSNEKLLDRASSPIKIFTPTQYYADVGTNTDDIGNSPVDGFVRDSVCDRCKSIFTKEKVVVLTGKEKTKPAKSLVINDSNTANSDDDEYEIEEIFNEMRVGFESLSPIPSISESENSLDIFLSSTATEISKSKTSQTEKILEIRTEALENLSNTLDNLDSSISLVDAGEIVEQESLNDKVLHEKGIKLTESKRFKSKIEQDNNDHQKQILRTGLRLPNKKTKLTQSEIEALFSEFSKEKNNSIKEISSNVLNKTKIINVINVVDKHTPDVFVASTTSEINERQCEGTLQTEIVLENRTKALEALSKAVSNLENNSQVGMPQSAEEEPRNGEPLKESKKNNKKLTKLQRFRNKCTPKGKIQEDNNYQSPLTHTGLRSISKEKKFTQSELEASRKKAVALIAEFNKEKSHSKNLISPTIDTANTIVKDINITNADINVENETVSKPQKRTRKRNLSVTTTEISPKRVLRRSNSKLGCDDNNLSIDEDREEYNRENNYCKENSPTTKQSRNRNNSINSSLIESVKIKKSTICLRSSRNKSNDENENIEKSKTLFENKNGEVNTVAYWEPENSPIKRTRKRNSNSNSSQKFSGTIQKSTRCLRSSRNKSIEENEETAKINADSIVSEKNLSQFNKIDRNRNVNSPTHQTKENNEIASGSIVSYGDLDMFSTGEASSETKDDTINSKENNKRISKHSQSPKNRYDSVQLIKNIMKDCNTIPFVLLEPLELMQNVKKQDVNRSHKILRTMIEKYVRMKPRKLKKKEDTDETTIQLSNLLEERIPSIIERTKTLDHREIVKSELDKLTVELSHSNCDHLIAGVVKYLMNPQRKTEMFNKIYAPPAPCMTQAEQMLLYVLLELRTHWPSTDIITILMKKIEQTLFNLNESPSFDATDSLSHFYAILCRSCNNLSKMRCFIMDAMYCIQFKSLCVIKQCLDVDPYVLPRANHHMAKNPLVVGMVYLMHFYKCNDKYLRIDTIRHILNKKYFYEFADWNEMKILDFIKKAILQMTDDELETKMLARVLVLFGKRHGNDWCYNNLIKRTLDPIIKELNVGERVRCFCLSMIGALVKAFNTGSMNLQINCILNTLTKMLSKRQTPKIEEAIVTGLIYMCRHDEVKVCRALMSWEPQTQLSQELHERMKNYIQEKTSKRWKYLITKKRDL